MLAQLFLSAKAGGATRTPLCQHNYPEAQLLGKTKKQLAESKVRSGCLALVIWVAW